MPSQSPKNATEICIVISAIDHPSEVEHVINKIYEVASQHNTFISIVAFDSGLEPKLYQSIGDYLKKKDTVNPKKQMLKDLKSVTDKKVSYADLLRFVADGIDVPKKFYFSKKSAYRKIYLFVTGDNDDPKPVEPNCDNRELIAKLLQHGITPMAIGLTSQEDTRPIETKIEKLLVAKSHSVILGKKDNEKMSKIDNFVTTILTGTPRISPKEYHAWDMAVRYLEGKADGSTYLNWAALGPHHKIGTVNR